MSATFDISDIKRRMQGAVGALKHELGGLRTGRASASLIEPVHVEAYGQSMPLNQVATISVPESRMLSVQVWDKGLVKNVDKAIREAGLGLNPQSDGQLLRVPVPELNEERRKELARLASKYAEQARVAVRNVRRDVMADIKEMLKEKLLSQDDERRAETEVQKLTDRYIAEIDQTLAAKEKEIMQV